MSYDPNNVFAKILRGEIPCTKVYEDDYTLAFNDIAPHAPVHILAIPKGPYETYGAFVARARDDEIIGFARSMYKIIAQAGLPEGGYRLITNAGSNGGQEVPHYHVHILGGRNLGPLLGTG